MYAIGNFRVICQGVPDPYVRDGYALRVRHHYDASAIRLYVSRAIDEAPRGTQSALGRAIDVPAPTINKWTQRQTCPSPEYWPGIERYFGWEPGTLAQVGGLEPTVVTEVEAAILGAGELTEDEREALLRLYYVLRDRRAVR